VEGIAVVGAVSSRHAERDHRDHAVAEVVGGPLRLRGLDPLANQRGQAPDHRRDVEDVARA
jgi:hypothetical protein